MTTGKLSTLPAGNPKFAPERIRNGWRPSSAEKPSPRGQFLLARRAQHFATYAPLRGHVNSGDDVLDVGAVCSLGRPQIPQARPTMAPYPRFVRPACALLAFAFSSLAAFAQNVAVTA